MKLLSSILIAFVLCSCSLPKQYHARMIVARVFGIPRASQYDKAYFDQSSIDLNNQNVQNVLRTHYSQGFKIALPRDPSSQREPTSSQVPTQAKRQLIKNEQLVQVSLGDGWEEASSPSPNVPLLHEKKSNTQRSNGDQRIPTKILRLFGLIHVMHSIDATQRTRRISFQRFS